VLAEKLGSDIGRFLRQHPAVRVSLDERVSQDIVRAVREGAADVGVLWDATDLSGLDSASYRRDQLCLVTPAAHRWARRKRIGFAEALDDVAVSAAPGGMMDVLLRREAAKLGRVPDWRIQVSGMDAAARIVAAGLGPAVLPREAIEGHASLAQLALVPLTDDWAVRRFRICTRSDGSTAATKRLLVEHLHQAAAKADAAA
jgi:DNA-binding transcriptional LysR family regulator